MNDSTGADIEAGPPRAALIAALVVAVGTIGVILGIAATRHHTDPVVVAAVPAPRAQDPACRTLIDALPERLGDYVHAPLAQPAPVGAAAWRPKGSGDPVVLRCGLERPTDFVVGSPIQVVNRVQWFRVSQDERTTWYTVDRPVYVALTLPQGSGPTPIQQLSDLIDHDLPARPIDPVRN